MEKVNIRWDRNKTKWGLIDSDPCSYSSHYDYGVLTDVTLNRTEVIKRGCSPSDIVGWANGVLMQDLVINSLTLENLIDLQPMVFNGRDFYCGIKHVISTPLMLMFKGGLCLIRLPDGSSQQQLSCSVAT